MSDYATMNDEAKASALLQRLNMLEAEHYKHSALAEEEEAMGNEAGAAELRNRQLQLVPRIEFVKAKMVELGVQFGEQPATEEGTDE